MDATWPGKGRIRVTLPKHPPTACFAKFRLSEMAGNPPNVVHLGVRRGKRNSRLDDQEDARAEQEHDANAPEQKRHPAGIEPCKGHGAQSNARRHKRAEAEVELRQRLLADPGANRGAT